MTCSEGDSEMRDTARPSKTHWNNVSPHVIGALALVGLVLAYAGLCLVVLHRPEWLPSGSIFHASLIGPPHLLVWGGTRTLFWASTLALAGAMALGACFRVLVLPSAVLCILIWLGTGFFSVALSV